MEFENLLTLIREVSDSDLTEFQYEENGINLRFVKETSKTEMVLPAQNPAVAQSMTDGASDKALEQEGKIVRSPLVGTFYAAPSEDAEPFVAAGAAVKKGQTLGIVEAMKLMNEIESEYEGNVAEILVKNGQMVEYGQPLFRIQ